MGGELFGADEIFTGISTDSRSVQQGELFFALKGEHFDGHEMCDAAHQLGAVASVTERDIKAAKPYVKVANTRVALGQLAHHWRKKHDVKLVGVTGSNGKTTVKEMLACVLNEAGSVLATKGNFNNDIGLPKTLFELTIDHEFAVIEMGANHIGEIENLASIAQPQVSVVTLCAPAHLEGFGSIEGVAQAKGEIFSSLPVTGTAVINRDDAFYDYWVGVSGPRKKISFGLDPHTADVYATNMQPRGLGEGTSFMFHFRDESTLVTIPHDGHHNVLNALAAGASALALDCSLEQVSNGLANSVVVTGRLNFHSVGDHVRIIDDTYNANPASLMAAVKVAVETGSECWVVIGDMGELGASGPQIHQECGTEIAATGVTRLFTFGELAAFSGEAFGANAKIFDDKNTLVETLLEQLKKREFKPLARPLARPLVILVKGSRYTQMETIVQALLASVRAAKC